jgi:RNA polymerase sigma-70 factor (ECF subfamily)
MKIGAKESQCRQAGARSASTEHLGSAHCFAADGDSVMMQNVISLSAVRALRRTRADASPVRSKLSLRVLPDVSQASSDAELIRSISQSEKQAMALLFARHNVRVFRFALSVTRDRSLAESVVSDVFLDVWRHAGAFKGKSEISTWLLGIARHKALTLLKRSPGEQLTDEFAESIEDAADDPEAAMEKKQARAIVAECLVKLSPTHREIIDLVYYHEKTIDEVTEILQIPRGTVKTRMFYARQQLARLLASKGSARVSSLL